MFAECEAAIKGDSKVLGERFVLDWFSTKENLVFAVNQSVAEMESGNCSLSWVWVKVPVDEVLLHYL